MDFPASAPQVMTELGHVLSGIESSQFDAACDRIVRADRTVLFGLGREGLVVRGFCMRLMHLGLDAHMAGDVTAKPVGHDGVLLVSSGPGNLTMTSAMITLGKRAGAHVVVVTGQPDSPDARAADSVLCIPAQTMATDRDSTSILAMGTAFELAMAITFDLAVIGIQHRLGKTLEEMRNRHFNLE